MVSPVSGASNYNAYTSNDDLMNQLEKNEVSETNSQDEQMQQQTIEWINEYNQENGSDVQIQSVGV